MSAPFAAAGAALATLGYWNIATRAAGQRGLAIGTLPPLLPLLAAVIACVAAVAGRSPAAIAAVPSAAVTGLIDARTGFIFDPLTLTAIVTSAALATVAGSAPDSFAGATVAGGILLLMHVLTGGRGLGLGDVKFGAAAGMALGAWSGLSAVACAFVFGGAYGAWLLATRARAGTRRSDSVHSSRPAPTLRFSRRPEWRP